MNDSAPDPKTSSHPFTIAAGWPFDVRRVPFYYGWAILGLSALGFLMSVPGQTMGMGVFTEPFIDAFGLSRTQLSIAYFFGTLGSSLFLTRAGRLYDQIGARTMLVGSSIALALVVGSLAAIGSVSSSMASLTGAEQAWFAFPLLLVGYFGVRFAGQGVLTSASRNILLGWFQKRRGLVSGVRGVFVSIAFSIAPLVLALLIDSFSWRGALFLLAGIVGIGFAAIALIFARDTPESCGVVIDGGAPTADEPEPPRFPDRTIHEARQSAVFWIFAAGLMVHALFGTAVTFHVVSIFAEAGRSQAEAFGYFFPQAVVSTTVNLTASALADRYPLKPFLIAMLASFCVGAVGLLSLDENVGYWMLVVGFGAGGGLWIVLSTLAFVRHFGLRHLGEISGLNTSLSVFGSALGPVLFSLAADGFGAYRAAVLLCLVLNAGLLIAAIVIPQSDPAHSRERSREQGL